MKINFLHNSEGRFDDAFKIKMFISVLEAEMNRSYLFDFSCMQAQWGSKSGLWESQLRTLLFTTEIFCYWLSVYSSMGFKTGALGCPNKKLDLFSTQIFSDWLNVYPVTLCKYFFCHLAPVIYFSKSAMKRMVGTCS